MKELVKDVEFLQYLSTLSNNAELPVKINGNGDWNVEDISGNINRVKRVSPQSGTNGSINLIIKHVPSGGKLARFPSISFSSERLNYEYDWFKMAQEALDKSRCENKLARLPNIYHYDKELRVLIMEDLGELPLNKYLEESNITELTSEPIINNFKIVARTMAFIHNWSCSRVPKKANLASQQNRPYLFSLHLDEPDTIIKLWKEQNYALKKITFAEKQKLQSDFLTTSAKQVKPILSKLKSQFEQEADSVYVHGDLHTGSLILNNGSIAMIDAELSDKGPAAFDIGCLLAHLIASLAAKDVDSQQSIEIARSVARSYIDDSAIKDSESLNSKILEFAGAEILRRLLGPAPFTHNLNLTQYKSLLDLSLQLLSKEIK